MNPEGCGLTVVDGECPLCGQPNGCKLCTTAAYKGACWCMDANIPDELLARVPADFRNRACICRACVENFHHARSTMPALRPEDYYFDKGLVVFVEAYLLRRGYCCENDCRHCPYPK
jgi:hypothetical protein